MKLKQFIPAKAKLKFRIFKRFISDLKYSRNRFCNEKDAQLKFQNFISSAQEIKNTAFFENKIHNITVAAEKIDNIVILPGQLFSFWKIVGAPTYKNNFKTGRNIIKGEISEDIGGGLCQVSGIVYLNCLKADLKIIERHNHSVDIYTEEQRFAPLGADATIVYGYKDFRFINNRDESLKLNLFVDGNQLYCILSVGDRMNENEVRFEKELSSRQVEVVTYIGENPKYKSVYKLNN